MGVHTKLYNQLMSTYDFENMTEEEAQKDVTPQELIFCNHYLKSYNRTMAAKKAKYSTENAGSMGAALLNRPRIAKYIMYRLDKTLTKHFFDINEIVSQNIKIAMQDMGDFVKLKGGKIQLNNLEDIDGQLVQEIGHSKYGPYVKLYDKFKAIKNLSPLIEGTIEMRRLNLEEEKVAILKARLLHEIERDNKGVDAEKKAELLKKMELRRKTKNGKQKKKARKKDGKQ